jgi:Fe-S-cluster containining protein
MCVPKTSIRFACNGCGVCCKGRLIPLTLNETRQWLARGHDVAIVLEAFNDATWAAEPQQFAHSVRRAAEVRSGSSKIQVIAVFTANALSQCPNLGADDRCGIYEERPLVCRIYPMEINPFIPLRPENKSCPPETWQTGEVLFTDRIVDPTLARQVEQSRQADRDDAQAKIDICEYMGLTTVAWKNNAMAVYQPDRQVLMAAIDACEIGHSGPKGKEWSVRVDQPQLRQQLLDAHISLDDAPSQDYIFHAL